LKLSGSAGCGVNIPMLGKVARALIRNEADAYRAQGLQEEALALFRKALSSSAHLPADVRAAIEQEIHQIEEEMAGVALDEGQQLSEEQIAVIRQGWSENATTDELVVSANTLHALGRYSDALGELSKAVQKGHSLHRAIGPMADCLAHLHEPESLPGGVQALILEMGQNPKAFFPITLSVAEHMWKAGKREHAAALGRHLSEYKGVPRDYRTRLEALLRSIKSSKAPKKPLPDPDSPTAVEPSAFRSLFERVRKAFRSFTARR
jgi:tetratricopeptide (TPR) repeat protein